MVDLWIIYGVYDGFMVDLRGIYGGFVEDSG